jgi:methionyl aminopeptidase
MITLKSAHELALMRDAGRIVAEVLAGIRAAVAPGVTTADLEAIADQIIVGKYQAIPSFKGYRGFPGMVCSSVNEEIVHGIPGQRVLGEGDIVSVDVGVIYKGYHGDSAITVGVGQIDADRHRGCQAWQLDDGHFQSDSIVCREPGILGGARVHGPRDRPADARGSADPQLF